MVGEATDVSYKDLVDVIATKVGSADLDETSSGNEYTVTVKPKAALTSDQLATLEDQDITVKVTATLR